MPTRVRVAIRSGYAREVTGTSGSGGIRALSFDLFDTLVDLRWDAARGGVSSTRLLHRAVAEYAELELEGFSATLAEVDRSLREPRYAHGIEVPTIERFALLIERLGIEAPALPEQLTEIHMDVIRGQVELPPHHPELLQTLRRGVRVGLCSNFSHAPTAHRILRDFELASCLDAVVISEEIGLRKPRREIFEAVLEALETAPRETLHIGDSLRADVAGAAAVGMRTVWVTRCVSDPDAALADHEGPQPDWIVPDLDRLPELIGSVS